MSVSMTSGPERPDAVKGDREGIATASPRSPDAMDLELGIRVVRFPGEQCGQDESWGNQPQRTEALLTLEVAARELSLR
jgi:hypothetical protein